MFYAKVITVDSFLSFLLKHVSFSPAHPRFAHHRRTSTNENHSRSMVRLGLTELKELGFLLESSSCVWQECGSHWLVLSGEWRHRSAAFPLLVFEVLIQSKKKMLLKQTQLQCNRHTGIAGNGLNAVCSQHREMQTTFVNDWNDNFCVQTFPRADSFHSYQQQRTRKLIKGITLALEENTWCSAICTCSSEAQKGQLCFTDAASVNAKSWHGVS